MVKGRFENHVQRIAIPYDKNWTDVPLGVIGTYSFAMCICPTLQNNILHRPVPRDM